MEDQAEKFRQQKKYNQLLLIGAARGYYRDVEALVELGAALDFKDKKGLAALHYAAGNGQLEVVRYLWSKGAEVDAEAPDGRTPLHLAALKGHPDCVTFLLQKGAWIDAEDARDNTPLHLAASRGHVAAVEALLKHGAKVKGVNKHGLTPVGSAVIRGQTETAKKLLGWGASFGERPSGYSLLHLAAGKGQLEAVRMLIDHGADLNDCDNPEGANPLHSAVLGGEAACVELLLQAGSDASAADSAGRLPADLLPEGAASKQGAAIKELLGAAKGGSGKKGGKARKPAAPPKSPHEVFQGLSEEERRSKVELWSTMGDADLAAALAGYPADVAAEVAKAIKELKALRARINIHQALAAAHADEEFQSDAAQPHVRAAIDTLRQDPNKYDQYAGDPVIVSVLGKMRRLHGVCQANGQRTVDITEMVVMQGMEEQDAQKGAALAAEYQAHVAAAAAAAAAPEDAAAEAAAGAYTRSLEAAQKLQEEQTQKAEKGLSQGKQEPSSLLRQRGAATGSTQSEASQGPAAAGKSVSFDTAVAGDGSDTTAADEASAAAIRKLEERGKSADEEDEENLPDWLKGGFSWKKVWVEFWHQCQLAILLLVVFLLITWAVRGRPPWVGTPRPDTQSVQESVVNLIQDAAIGRDGGADAHVDL